MTAPRRIQRKRSAGWRKPENTVNITRPGPWGNPYILRNTKEGTTMGTEGSPSMGGTTVGNPRVTYDTLLRDSVAAYEQWVRNNPEYVARAKQSLAGKNLMCWCPEDSLCHGDVLLQIANEPWL